MSVIKMTDSGFRPETRFYPCDLNVPVKEAKVISDARIRAFPPTIELPHQGAKVMVTSPPRRPTEGEQRRLSAAG